jgi:putative oxidoreductase
MKNSNAASRAYALVRIIIGFFLIYHGKEVFETNKISEYAQWDVFKNFPQAYWIAFAGKAAELIAGIMLVVGYKTAWASVILVGTMLFISFFIGHGKVWLDDQHPFLFVLFGIQYFFGGAGIWSIDSRGKGYS